MFNFATDESAVTLILIYGRKRVKCVKELEYHTNQSSIVAIGRQYIQLTKLFEKESNLVIPTIYVSNLLIFVVKPRSETKERNHQFIVINGDPGPKSVTLFMNTLF